LSINLYPGDCLEVMKTIPDGSVDMILCDLPYGTTQNKWDAVIPLDELWAEYKRITKPNSAMVLTAQTPFDKVLGSSNLSMLKYEWIWEKENATGFLNAKKAPLTLPTYNPQMRTGFKPYKCKQGRPSTNYGKVTPEHLTESVGNRYPVTVLPFSRDRQKIHPTQKPLALMEYLIETYTNEGDTVLDNCMGSGTTGVACVNTNRSFIGIEKDERYFGIAERRINDAIVASVPNFSLPLDVPATEVCQAV
jgi:site-specific DNA-methyltransferase (adenine-specific)